MPRDTIVELAIRYGLITHHTSYYVPSARELEQLGRQAHLLERLDIGPRPLGTTWDGRAENRLLAAAIAAPLALMGCSRPHAGEDGPAVHEAERGIAPPPAAPSRSAPTEPASTSEEDRTPTETPTGAADGPMAALASQSLRPAAAEAQPSPTKLLPPRPRAVGDHRFGIRGRAADREDGRRQQPELDAPGADSGRRSSESITS